MPIAPPPRVVVIDDDLMHLNGLVDALHRCGMSCRPLHYPDDLVDYQSNPHVRVIFADLNLIDGDIDVDFGRCYDAIAGLISKIEPAGPYFVVLWTQHDTYAGKLKAHLDEKLGAVVRPLAVTPLPKEEYMDLSDGSVQDPSALEKAVGRTLKAEPQVAALLSWEAHVMKATGDTVAEVGRLAKSVDGDSDVSRRLAVLLAKLAVEAVGRYNVERNRFGAIGQALMPMLEDRLAASVGETVSEDLHGVWQAAFNDADMDAKSRLSPEIVGALNSAWLLAYDDPGAGDGRGVVLRFSDVYPTKSPSVLFNVDESKVAKTEYRCKDYGEADDCCTWVLVQAQATCDHAQRRCGPLPYYLGLELPAHRNDKSGKPPAACWTSPVISLDSEQCLLRVNARFGVFLTRDVAQSKIPMYRLREQTINYLVHHIHAYGARPGMMFMQ